MKESLSQQTANLKHKNNRHKRWKGIVSILACMVVFCTVYALILPALTAEGTPHCGKEEHTHTEDCYEKKLICGKEEGEGAHQHSDDCYREEQVLVCTTPESDGHQHTDDCYTEEQVLTCTNADPDHVHNDIDGCYTIERKLICGKEEGEDAHHHTEECYETKRELICGQEENDGHQHTDDCYKKELVCGKEEHKHILACYSDPNADVEDGNVWQRTVSSVALTGNWGADLAAIAQTQNGYTESTANYAVAEDGQTIHGYTRYGAWANDPYRDNWSAQFADFCLSYAGVPTSAVPQNSDCSAWNYTIPDGYTPKTGDLLLLDTDSNGSADHAGIVTSVSDSTLSTIVGDADKAVRNNTYNIGSETIKGYVSIPENPALATPTPEPTKEPEVTPEAQPTQEPEATPEVTEEPTQEPENKADDAADDKADENKTQDEDVKEDDGKKDDTANNNIEVTPTPEVTETPEATPTATPVTSHKKPHKAPAKTNENVDQRIKVDLSSSKPTDTTGNTLSAKVVSTYSQANNPNSNATVCVKIGTLPEGIQIQGFSQDGKKTVTYNDGKNSLEVELKQENGEYYIEYSQPAGSTVEFDVQLSSVNGIMPAETKVTLSVDKNKTKAPEGTSGSDYLDDTQDLTWTAKNEWDKVSKKVNNQDKVYTKVSGNNLTGSYEYTITANHSNGENYGEIWTDYITVTDTFTLPERISFPSGTKVQDNKVVTETGESILFFNSDELQGGTITGVTLNGKTVTYTLQIPNQHKENGIPTKEQDNLNIKMHLDANKLIVPSNYKDLEDSVIQSDIINNHVLIQPTPYKPYDVQESEDDAQIIPAKDPEDIKVGKTADKTSVKAGETITYTLSVKNNSTTSNIAVKDSQGNLYKVTDTLPKYLELTDAQKQELTSKGIEYTENNGIYTLSWVPSETNIGPGEEKTVSFTATVRAANDSNMSDLKNDSDIVNKAQYKKVYSADAKVQYHKGYTNIGKTSDATDATLNNGAIVTYTVTITNPTDIPVADEVIRDTLPNGLEFVSAQIGNDNISETKQNILIDANHKCDFSVKNQILTWKIDKIDAHETLTLTYKCRVNTDQTGGATALRNSVTTESGGKGETDIHVKDPIEITKTVDKDTSKVYPDGQIFNYTITLKNDKSNPNSVKNQYLTDQLPSGMILDNSIPLKKQEAGGETTVSWEDFYNNTSGIREQNTKFYATFGEKTAEVTFENSGITLKWKIDELKPDESVTIEYPAKIILTEEQKNNGGSYEFTNTVKYLERSKSVTVYGGSEKGKLYLQKTFDGKCPYLEENYQAKYPDITFTILGKNSSGESIYSNTVKFSDFTKQEWNSWKLGYAFDDLPVGSYTITESNADIQGKNRVTTYKVKIVSADGKDLEGENSIESFENATPEVFDCTSSGKASKVTVDNVYTEPKTVDLQKSVWGIYTLKPYLNNGSQIASKDVFDVTGTKVVAYTVTVVNTGEEPVTINEIQDELPEGLTYKGLSTQRNWLWQESYDTTNYVNNQIENLVNDSFMTIPAGYSFASGVKLSATQNGQSISINVCDGFYKLQKNQLFSFLVLCETNAQTVADIPMTNTAKLIAEKDVNYKDYKEIKTTGTPVDANQNNGSSRDEGIQNGKRVISSEVTITPINQIIPGITKNAVGYIKAGESQLKAINTNDNIIPESAVKWLVTLYNDGVQEMSDYTVQDIVTNPFHLITKDEAGRLHKGVIQQAYKYTIYNAAGGQIYTEDITESVWNIIQDQKLNKFEFAFHDSKYNIPAGGYATLELYTENENHTQYQIYTNTATIIPVQEFNANGVKSGHGELVKNDLGEYIGVKASASVNALGEYGTVSWKTITEDGNSSNTASGSDDRNYITVDKNVGVIYRNHIKNVSTKKLQNIVMIDMLPGLNDTGVVNQQDRRDSEFTVSFAEGLDIYKVDANNNKTSVRYTVRYSSKTSFTEDEFKGNLDTAKWHDQWQPTDKSFAVKLDEEINPQDTLIYEYKGKLEKDAAPGLIAWNSFGYRYQAEGKTDGIIAEPPKVGVKIPASSPIIRKEVVDSNGKTLEADENKKFHFVLKDGNTELAKFDVSQGSYKDFKDLTDSSGNPITLVNGKEYQIEEVNIPEGYKLLGIGEEGKALSTNSCSFTYYEKQNLVIIAKNQTENNQKYELPETGGIGTNRFTAVGLALMTGSLMCGYVMRRKRRERRGN